MSTRTAATRRTVLTTAVAAPAAAGLVATASSPAAAGAPSIVKPVPASRFYDYGTNAEMRWDSVDPRRFATSQADLFVRNHTSTPTIDPTTYALRGSSATASPGPAPRPRR
ncbi:hypothetical protein [Nocardioides litoris]|uniref:hypothetical protein n=1 Tax=Nocardioides litoris TaxID=1926648 RepID=UPI001B882FF1|nr:hypothetical protein [Nocardioides litoris]